MYYTKYFCERVTVNRGNRTLIYVTFLGKKFKLLLYCFCWHWPSYDISSFLMFRNHLCISSAPSPFKAWVFNLKLIGIFRLHFRRFASTQKWYEQFVDMQGCLFSFLRKGSIACTRFFSGICDLKKKRFRTATNVLEPILESNVLGNSILETWSYVSFINFWKFNWGHFRSWAFLK